MVERLLSLERAWRLNEPDVVTFPVKSRFRESSILRPYAGEQLPSIKPCRGELRDSWMHSILCIQHDLPYAIRLTSDIHSFEERHIVLIRRAQRSNCRPQLDVIPY